MKQEEDVMMMPRAGGYGYHSYQGGAYLSSPIIRVDSYSLTGLCGSWTAHWLAGWLTWNRRGALAVLDTISTSTDDHTDDTSMADSPTATAEVVHSPMHGDSSSGGGWGVRLPPD
jgi:hypothetical protein